MSEAGYYVKRLGDWKKIQRPIRIIVNIKLLRIAINFLVYLLASSSFTSVVTKEISTVKNITILYAEK